MSKRHTKQPAEVKDYDFEWQDWLSSTDGDTISSSTVTVLKKSGNSWVADSPVTLTLGTKTHTNGTGDSSDLTNQTVKQVISAGTNGLDYKVTCSITTAESRTAEAEIFISVRER